MPLLTGDSDDLRPLYVFEARVSLLARLALSPVGAQALLQAGVTAHLADLTCLEYRPAHAAQGNATPMETDWLPGTAHRYR